MPDGDIVNSKLKRCYHKPYMMICESAIGIPECASSVLSVLKKEIQRGGNSPFELAKVLSHKISENSNLIELKQSHKLKEILRIEMRESRISVKKIGILENSINSLIHDLRYKNISPTANFHKEIVKKYLVECYTAFFVGKINSTTKHYKDADPIEVQTRIYKMKALIDKTVHAWTNTIIKDGDVKKLKQLKTKKKNINLEENLL